MGPRRRDAGPLAGARPGERGATTQEIAIPNPPPPPPPPPNVEPPRQRSRVDDEPMEPISFTIGDRSGLAPWAAVAVGVAAVPIGLLLLFALAVVGWKALRRHRRRTRPTPTARIAGAWAEAIDRCTEAGAPPMTAVTPRERVQAYVREQHLDDVEPDLRVLAGHVDRATYAASAPDDGHAADAWRASDEVSRRVAPHPYRRATVADAPGSPPPASRPRDIGARPPRREHP